jgi:chemotaxis protein methyltransferase CheR
VLRARLARQAPLLPALAADRPHLDDPGWAALLDGVTVPETRLFRAAPQLEALAALALPPLAAAAAREGRALRLLSAGCATGEEAYSLALLGLEAASACHAPPPVEVLGLDLSRPALAAAAGARWRLGPPAALREVPARFLPAFEVAGGWVSPGAAARDPVRLARASLTATLPAEPPWDVVVCRNVLIYLTDAARALVGARLAAALRPGGALLLGATDRTPRGFGLHPWHPDHPTLLRRADRNG